MSRASSSTTRPWTAEISLGSADRVRILEHRFPDLVPCRPVWLGEGWDCVAVAVGDLVFRFPRRAVAVPLLEREVLVLGPLLRALPVRVPVVVRVGRPVPSDGFPWLVVGTRRVPGRSLDLCWDRPGIRERLAGRLGEVLGVLHRTPPPEGLPEDEIGRMDPDAWTSRVESRLPRIRLPSGVRADQVLGSLRERTTLPSWRGELVSVHGDLYTRHLMIGDEGGLVGVIDWGDAHRGDPASDLAVVHTVLPPSVRPAFLDLYGAVDDDTWERARARAIQHSVCLLDYAQHIEDAILARVAGESLRLALGT